MSPTERQISVNTNQITIYEWGSAQHPTLVFFHATGFHGRCWDEVIRHLPGFHCIAVDAWGHGKSGGGTLPHTWQQYGDDAAQVARELGLTEAIGIGHSMGGNSLVRATAALPGAFKSLLLVDPVIFPREQYTLDEYSIDGHFILNRRREWDSVDEMVKRFRGRGPFEHWQDAVLRDYCQYGVRREGDHYVLACAPEVEAHIYSSSRLRENADIYGAVAAVKMPVRVLRCGLGVTQSPQDLMKSPTAVDLAAQFAQGEDSVLPDNSHFIPMEVPEIVAQHIQQLQE